MSNDQWNSPHLLVLAIVTVVVNMVSTCIKGAHWWFVERSTAAKKHERSGSCCVVTPIPIGLRDARGRSGTNFGIYIHEDIGDQGARLVARFLANYPTNGTSQITELDLYANQIGPEGAKALGYALAIPLPTLAHSFLSQRVPHGCDATVASFSRALEHLNLDRNLLGDSGARFLAKGLQDHPRLQFLSLCSNGIGDEGALALSKLVVGTCPRLRVLRLSNNKITGPRSIQNLACSLNSDGSALEEFNFDGNNLGFEGAKAVASVLCNNTSIKNLNLRNCSIGTKGALLLADSLIHNQCLEMLFLDGNAIGEEGAQRLIKIMEGNKNIRSLKLTFGNNISKWTSQKLEVLNRRSIPNTHDQVAIAPIPKASFTIE